MLLFRDRKNNWSASWALNGLDNLFCACNRPFVLLHHFFKGLHHIIMCIGIQLCFASPSCCNSTVAYNICSNCDWYLEWQHFRRVQECIKNLFCIPVLGNVQSKEDSFNLLDKDPQICYCPTVTAYNFFIKSHIIKSHIIKEIFVLWLLYFKMI